MVGIMRHRGGPSMEDMVIEKCKIFVVNLFSRLEHVSENGHRSPVMAVNDELKDQGGI